MKPSNPTEWYRACIVEALEQRAADHEARALANAGPVGNPLDTTAEARHRHERADECRTIARMLRNEDLPGCESEDHL